MKSPALLIPLVLIFLGTLTMAPAESPAAPEPAGDLTVAALPLTDLVSIGDLTVGLQQTQEILIPGSKVQPGKIRILRFRAFAYTTVPAGSNFNMEIEINHHPITRHTPDGKERLIGRSPTYQFKNTHPGVNFHLFSETEGHRINLLFAPDIGAADGMTTDGQGSCFAFNISDKAGDFEDYIITFRNIRRPIEGQDNDLVLEAIETGWLDANLAP